MIDLLDGIEPDAILNLAREAAMHHKDLRADGRADRQVHEEQLEELIRLFVVLAFHLILEAAAAARCATHERVDTYATQQEAGRQTAAAAERRTAAAARVATSFASSLSYPAAR